MDENIISGPNVTYIPHPGGLGCAMFEKMCENQDRIAQINGITGEEETFKSVLLRSIRTAVRMRSKGLKPNDIITICGIPSTDICIPYIASIFLGVIPSALDPFLSKSDIIHLIKQVKPKMVFIGQEATEIMEAALKEVSLNVEIVVFGNTSGHTAFSEFLQSSLEEDDFKPRPVENLKETVAISFSSGTTGFPKGICLNHQGFQLQCHRTGSMLPSYKMLSFGTFYWISTINFLISSMLAGFSRVVVPIFDLEKFWPLLNEFKLTTLFLSPSLLVTLLKAKRPTTSKKSALKMIVVSGGPVSEKHIREFQEMVPEALVALAYAQTEITGAGLFFNVDKPEKLAFLKQKPTSSGTALPGFSFKIVDVETGKILGPNQNGELRIKCKSVMNGYYNMDSKEAFDEDGWLRTGDIAYYDEDHCFYIVDRIKEVFKYRSYQIVPTVIEKVLLEHPAVEMAVVFGVPHEVDGEHPKAVVTLSKNFQLVSSEEIIEFADAKLSDAQKLRGGLKIIENIPLTITGKIKRRELKYQAINGEL